MKYKILREDETNEALPLFKRFANYFGMTDDTAKNILKNNLGLKDRGINSTSDYVFKGMINRFANRSSDNSVFQQFTKGTTENFSFTNFPQWLTGQVARLFNDDQDAMVKYLPSGVINWLRKIFIQHPSTMGGVSTGLGAAASAGIGAGAKKIAEDTGLYKNYIEPIINPIKTMFGIKGDGSEQIEQAKQAAGSNGLLYGAAAAGVGAGLLWLYNKFKNNPRKQLSPQEIAYAMKLNQQTPNQGQ